MMAINEWWSGDPAERYWLEITDRDDLGGDLHAPKADQSGKQTWSYTLVNHVQPGDVVFHYWKQVGQPKAIVGHSVATGAPESSTIRWQAHGTFGRAAGRATTRASWRVPLSDFTDLTRPVTLEDLRVLEPTLRALTDELATTYAGPLYLPFVFSERRPLRTAQGYLAKLPAAFVNLIPRLNEATRRPKRITSVRTTPAEPQAGPRSGAGYQHDVEVRTAIERHAMNWAMTHFLALGYRVEDVSANNPFDILATSDDHEVHIEVKGSAGTATTVELTTGEVNEATSPGRATPTLVVVDEIRWTRVSDGTITTAGGRPRIWSRWEPHQDRLTPTRYRYLLTPDADHPAPRPPG